MSYEVSKITTADQDLWKDSGIAADQTSNNMPNYADGKVLTLCEDKAVLSSFELDGEKYAFAKFNVVVDGENLKESGKQLFREVFVPLTEAQLANTTTYTIKSNGKLKTVKGIAWPESGVQFQRRFPTLNHQIDGSVPYVANAQIVNLAKLANVGIFGIATDGTKFIRIIDAIAVDAGLVPAK